MAFITTVQNALLKEGYRFIKVIRLGDNDVQEPEEVSPYGLDSNPVRDVEGIFDESGVIGEPLLMGYLNANRKAEPGEIRIYSTGDDQKEKVAVWLKKDGTILIGGDADNLVRYSKLEQAFNELRSDFNRLVNTFNAHVHAVSGSSTSPTGTQGQTSSADISGAKIANIKTN